ncbi:hypothetical protein [Mycobacterium deserti]|uniref:Uncharacterized protein n=1 Tax=Mycobacterium deserti TaxID=2978347 RepID=A0ABT2MIU2_9MYCO|nr:hypothetical protein [Mycobacterium deserti]MCT7661005.1 hypothetical protein [Mycobacterium deserti]
MTGLIASLVVGIIVALLLLTAWNLLRRPSERRTYKQTVGAIRTWMIPLAFAQAVLVAATVIFLSNAWPILSWGWWKSTGGSGNIVMGQTANEGQLWSWLSFAIPIGLAFLVPWLAHQEERVFRYGTEDDSWPRRLRTQTAFGLAHPLFMGVPIAAGLALILVGLTFQVVYLAAFRRSIAGSPRTAPIPPPVRLSYPAAPDGPYDPAKWDEHIQDCIDVGARNHRRIDDWADAELKRIEGNEELLRESRNRATAIVAAFHSIYNWLLLGLLVASLGAAST